jgi:SHS2 domain-containing protein
MQYEFLEHPADIKIRASGKDLPEVFINSALGMMDFIYGGDRVKIDAVEIIEVAGEDNESLLVNWLAEILAVSSVQRHKFISYKIKEFSTRKIIAEISGGPAIAQDEIKAVTYHDLELKLADNVWYATLVYDI